MQIAVKVSVLGALVVGCGGATVLSDGAAAREQTASHERVLASTQAPRAVPDVRGQGVVQAYARLRRAGFRVTIPTRVIVPLEGLDPDPVSLQTSPAAGKRLRAGDAVVLSVGPCRFCGIGSPAVPVHMPQYTVPSFTGRTAASAYAWTSGKTLYWTAYLGPLKAGHASTLYGNYRVIRQQPKPGARLTLGVGQRYGNGGTFTPTPLTIWATQTSTHR